MSTSSAYRCNRCGAGIYFDDEYVSPKTGKKIPLDHATDKPHDCPVWNKEHNKYKAKKLYCNACSKEIYFDDDYVTDTGKKIPLSKASKAPHRCRAKPFNNKKYRHCLYPPFAFGHECFYLRILLTRLLLLLKLLLGILCLRWIL